MSESIPSELDFDFEARRARLVRRRFLWMCGARIALAIIGGIAFLVFLHVGSEFRPPDRVRAAASLFNLLVFATAGAYAWRTPPHSRRLLRAVFWLVVLTGAANLVAARLIAGFDREPAGDPAAGYLQDALAAILINHFVAALFIRWSIREALAPRAGAVGHQPGNHRDIPAAPRGRFGVLSPAAVPPVCRAGAGGVLVAIQPIARDISDSVRERPIPPTSGRTYQRSAAARVVAPAPAARRSGATQLRLRADAADRGRPHLPAPRERRVPQRGRARRHRSRHPRGADRQSAHR